jgi:hypothetical protein
MTSLSLTSALAAALCLMTAACVDTTGDDVPERGRAAGDPATTAGAVADLPVLVAVPEADACVDEGCPAGLSCDWVQGCTEEVLFCCADEQCGEGRFCDFDAGGHCAPLPP